MREASRTVLIDRRHRDGRLMMTVYRYEDLGYGIAAPRHGRHLVSLDGRSILSAVPDVPTWKWQRLFFAQVLPLVATLQGLELLHASGVVIGGRSFGFVADSGTGKTTLAINLVAGGAQLLTDDVLAIDTHAARVRAFPGGGLASIHAEEYDAIPRGARSRLGEIVGHSDKIHLAPPLATGPAPLGAIYFLRREVDRSGEVTIETAESLPPQFLLAGRFISYLSEPRHLVAHLDAAARLSAAVPRFIVTVPGGQTPDRVADAVGTHAAAISDGVAE